MVGFIVFLILISTYLIHQYYKQSRSPHHKILRDIYKSLISLYPNTYFFGIRIIHHPQNSSLDQELTVLGLSRIAEIEMHHITVWKNNKNDVFIVQAVHQQSEQPLLTLEDDQFGRVFFYAYESIITLPLNIDSKGILTYLRQLSLAFKNPQTSTSVWITKCECLPGYTHFQNHYPHIIRSINQQHTLSELLNVWLDELHLHSLEKIPHHLSLSLKGEYIGTAHQLFQFLKSINSSLTGQLARPIQFGYVAMLSTTENSEPFDRLYTHWHIAPKDMVTTHTSEYQWAKLLKSPQQNHQSLQGVFIAFSLFIIFALSAKLISERLSHKHEQYAAPSTSNVLHIENQLLSEIGATIDPAHLLQLLGLHQSMQSLPAMSDRCQTYQSAIQKSADCAQINHVKLGPLPDDLVDRSQQILSGLTHSEKISLIAPKSTNDIQTSIQSLDVSSSCQINALLTKFKAGLFHNDQCATRIKSSLVSTLALNQLNQISQRMIPISDHDSLDMVLNKTEYYAHNMQELMRPIPSQLKALNQLGRLHPLNYKIHTQLKSLSQLTHQTKALEKTLSDGHNLLRQFQAQPPSQMALFYKEHVMTDPNILHALSNKPLDAKDEWTIAIDKVILNHIKATVVARINDAYQPIYQHHQQFLNHKFPLSVSESDANLDAFHQLLSPNGQMIQFFNAHITPFINAQHSDWICSEQPEFSLPLDKSLINAQMQIALTNEMFFHKKSSVWFESSMRLTRSSPHLQSVTIQTGGQSQTLQKNASSQMIKWLSDEDSHHPSAISLNDTDGTKSQIPFHGEFSGLRLLQSLKVTHQQSHQLFTVKIQKGNDWAELEVRMPHSINPLVNGISNQLQLQERIIIG